jgi:hypothetical protein
MTPIATLVLLFLAAGRNKKPEMLSLSATYTPRWTYCCSAFAELKSPFTKLVKIGERAGPRLDRSASGLVPSVSELNRRAAGTLDGLDILCPASINVHHGFASSELAQNFSD